MNWINISDEFKGHSLLEGARQADVARVKKYLSMEVVNFKHPYTGDAALVRNIRLFVRLICNDFISFSLWNDDFIWKHRITLFINAFIWWSKDSISSHSCTNCMMIMGLYFLLFFFSTVLHRHHSQRENRWPKPSSAKVQIWTIRTRNSLHHYMWQLTSLIMMSWMYY